MVKPGGLVVDDLRFQFKDGSLYEEITKFTQHGRRLFKWFFPSTPK